MTFVEIGRGNISSRFGGGCDAGENAVSVCVKGYMATSALWGVE